MLSIIYLLQICSGITVPNFPHLFITIILLVICFYHFCYSLNVFLLFNKFLQTCKKKKETAYLVPRAAITYYHKLEVGGGRAVLETEVHSLTLQEARGFKSRCQQGWFLPEVLKETLFHSSLLFPGGCQQSLLFLGLKLYHSNFYLHYHVGFSPGCILCVFLNIFLKIDSLFHTIINLF